MMTWTKTGANEWTSSNGRWVAESPYVTSWGATVYRIWGVGYARQKWNTRMVCYGALPDRID